MGSFNHCVSKSAAVIKALGWSRMRGKPASREPPNSLSNKLAGSVWWADDDDDVSPFNKPVLTLQSIAMSVYRIYTITQAA